MAEKLSEGREKKNISNKLTKTTTPERQEKKKNTIYITHTVTTLDAKLSAFVSPSS